METCEIVWTNRAVKDLKQVYTFYTVTIGEERAFQIIQVLLEKADILSDSRFVEIESIDFAFKHLKRSYKKLIVRSIKITYRTNKENSIVYINRVFDTRQNPNKNH